MMIDRKYLITLLTSLILLINFIIVPLDYLGIPRGAPVVIFTFGLSSFCFLIAVYGFFDASKMPRQFLVIVFLFFLLVVYPLIVSIVVNSPIEYLASFLRYMSYFFIFCTFYLSASKGVFTENNIYGVFKVIIIVSLLFSVYQILTGRMIYLNGANRLSSIYGATPAGFALLMLFLSVFFFTSLFVKRSNKRTSFFYFLFFVLSLLMMYGTQSRQALATFIGIAFLILLLRAKLIYKIAIVLTSIVSSYGLYWVFLNTSLFPRITDMLVRQGVDGSTQTRLNIINSSLSHLDFMESVFGIGLGGFNRYYYATTGELGVAAHNDYLLFYTEGGYLGLVSYIILSIGGALFWYRCFKKYGEHFLIPFSVHLAIITLSFLNNPFYYPQIMTLLFSVSGLYFFRYRECKFLSSCNTGEK
ncbi:O-antigen ligase family protein [Vibrio parahaemolyticus]|nr:O-antigen ligase family protein [Vibrio parahaemolyticus]EIU6801130.1 O-antigen ligase family protein [Vibrio parahaemolyticus]